MRALLSAAPGERGSTIIGSTARGSSVRHGAAYVFVRQNGAWVEEAYLKASNTNAGDRFGSAVAISGDTIVVGAYGGYDHNTEGPMSSSHD